MTNVYNRKRHFGATFRTLNDITNNGRIGENDAAGIENSNIAVQHIPLLPNDKEAAKILRRIHSEFHVIIERRGWYVVSITEMCCCGDGIDCLKNRRTKAMPDNVLGYNRTSSSRRGNVHDIHLRLRHPRTHEILDYESIAGTMCHELAHCVRGPHDAKFYKAMEEIEEQYSVYLARGVVLDRDGFPIGSSESHVLGSNREGGANDGRKNNASAARRRALDEAESRRKKGSNGLTRGNVLGGKSRSSPKDPREAARIAAERRLFDSQYCLPCNEVIEILGEDSDDDECDDEVEVLSAKNGEKMAAKSEKRRAKSDTIASDMKGKATNAADANNDVIDLTFEDSFNMSPVATFKSASKSKRKNSSNETGYSGSGQCKIWTCPRCTLCNPESILVCDACHSEQPCEKTLLEQAREFKKEDDIAYIKEREVEQSKETFGGFNIYGEKKNPSSTMKHLT
eukprot:CAMPEP_0172553808 /NCGR_PEP_ID=MMETSP1067-20121228/51783_1 /TAXON_ID=265564 ORGANISM="Thalassiosira punctigera, Strain Tpunct2005C2" /NCGR_SAMPLE_ID=MMETSP1067 /ASSEMBLY_ACC=CAM_ASM_000444 /LENGTH=454 /DNA_ID=CAMNT_0013342045 /DNA_START=231 /DNA_END=1595 /DNA_ORIENTATION=-